MQRFRPLPMSPNCVSSETTAGSSQFVAPIAFKRPVAEAKAQLRALVERLPRVTLEVDDGMYLHYVFRSALLAFADDVELRFDPATSTVRIRSASRVGFYDLGANRKRVEMLRELLNGKI